MQLSFASSNHNISAGNLYFFLIAFFWACSPPSPYSGALSPAEGEKKTAITESKDNFLLVLGEKLFFEKALSLDSTISCASCHIPEFAFSDTVALSIGVGGVPGKRNAPSLLNVSWATAFNRDGGVTSLQTQAITPITDPHEMSFDIHLAPKRLWAMYEDFFAENDIDTFSPSLLLDALATFQQSLMSGQLVIDTEDASDDAKIGEALFFSERTNCTICHTMPLYTNFSFENNGLYKVYTDRGREEITLDPMDRGKFKVPSLINVSLTGPYMHDGSLNTLKEVISH